MARPRKNKLAEVTTPEVEALSKELEIKPVINSTDNPPEQISPINSPVINPSPIEVKSDLPINPINTDEKITEKVDEKTSTEKILDSIISDVDKCEMSRYFRVIYNSTEASRINQVISHQRDLEMWGVHQYDNNRSRNSYSRSFYFKDRANAVIALQHALDLQKQV